MNERKRSTTFWTAPYVATWFLFLGITTDWLLATLTAAAYGAGHAYAAVRRQHVHLSADPVSLPIGVLAHLLGILLLKNAQYAPIASRDFIDLVLPVFTAWVLGHIGMAICAVVADRFSRQR